MTATYDFTTERLDVMGWHRAEISGGASLPGIIAGLLTPATTRELPPSWQGDYDESRAAGWIRERDAESTTLLVKHREAAMIVGLLIVSETPANGESERSDIRLGYLLADSAWGAGFGTELVSGFIARCRREPRVRSIAAGTSADNAASLRVLTRNGFSAIGPVTDGTQHYELVLEPNH